MSLEAMAFVLGGLLIAASVFGGGFEVKELKVPQIGGSGRIAAALVGASFIALALAINQKWMEHREATTPPKVDTSQPRTFQDPLYQGMRLDACFEWASRCGEEAATAWCKTQGYARASEFIIENVGARGVGTRLIGVQRVCQAKFCASFSNITCSGPAS